MLSKRNQIEKDKYWMISLIGGILKMFIDTENRLVAGRGRVRGEENEWTVSKDTNFQL